MFKAITLLLTTLVFCSCSGLGFLFGGGKSPFSLDDYQLLREADYSDHLVEMGKFYLESETVQSISLTNAQLDFLTRIYTTLITNNELLLSKAASPKFHIIVDPAPFHFSLPKAHFFLSTGLLVKYVKSEEILISILAYDTVKSIRGVYEKKTVVPTGSVTAERLLSMLRVDFETRNELNKWAFYMMKRSGYDAFVYLSWLQIQNKNSLDFGHLNFDVAEMSREESSFKSFIVSEGKTWRDGFISENNSSADFYNFIKYISGKKR